MKNKFTKNKKEIINEYQEKGYKANYRVDHMKLMELEYKNWVFARECYYFEGISL